MTPQAPSTLSMLTHHVSDLAKRTSNEELDEIEDIVVKDWNQQAMGQALTMLVGALFNKERHSRGLPLRHPVEQETNNGAFEKWSHIGLVNPEKIEENLLPLRGYKCTVCGVTGVKLWREFQISAQNSDLTCHSCTCDLEGKAHDYPEHISIGWRVAAIPCGDTFYGFWNVPEFDAHMWVKLPKSIQEGEYVDHVNKQ